MIFENSLNIFFILKTTKEKKNCLRAGVIQGQYELGKLNEQGQRINIRIKLERKNNDEMVTFISGWMVCPNGEIRLVTPYGGA